MAAIDVITPSFNKSRYVRDAIYSVLNQSFKDFHYHILENSTDAVTRHFVKSLVQLDSRVEVIDVDIEQRDRETMYTTARLLNFYLPLMTGEYVAYLSDDDILDPACFETCVAYMKEHPEAKVVYFSMDVTKEDGAGIFSKITELKAEKVWDKGSNLDCVIDGGQIFMRRECLDGIDQPYFETDFLKASHCDGIFLTKLCKEFTFYPINQTLMVHRRTGQSTWINT